MDDNNTTSASRKRKHNCHDRDDGIIIIEQEEDNEEEKMEKFFALVQNIREARNHLLNGSNAKKQLEIMETVRFNKRKLEGQVEVWKPTFRREDFLEETFDHRRLMMTKNNPPKSNHGSAAATPSQTQTKPKAIEREEIEIEEAAGLDLSLSL